MNGGNGPAGGITAPPAGPAAAAGAEADAGAAVVGGPATGMTGDEPETAPVVEATCAGGGEETGGGSNDAPPPPPAPSPALKPREKSLGAAGGTAEVGGVGRLLAGPLNPDPSEPADGVPVDIPLAGIPVDGKLSPLDAPEMGIDGVPV
ncbi:hypothetical protein [Mycolicibacterium moriokaense]|uniref:hypothetical protein n=1 Tax=Mycolicibacterium moriokaense TaxID=39691 RepID=UPI001F189420|nr:hypothetical protein [Mycolicibacterium moriokaense]